MTLDNTSANSLIGWGSPGIIVTCVIVVVDAHDVLLSAKVVVEAQDSEELVLVVSGKLLVLCENEVDKLSLVVVPNRVAVALGVHAISRGWAEAECVLRAVLCYGAAKL